MIPERDDRVTFRLADSDLAQYIDPAAHNKTLTGRVVSRRASPDGTVYVDVDGWAAMHEVSLTDLTLCDENANE